MTSSMSRVDRVRTLLIKSTEKSEFLAVYDGYLKELEAEKFVSSNELNELINDGKLTRCHGVAYCIPQEIIGHYVAIRLEIN